MLKPDDKEIPEAPAWLVRVVKLFGFTEVQARWRVTRALTRLRDGRQLVGFSRGHRRVLSWRIGTFPIATVGLMAAIFVVYGRMFVARPHDGIFSWDTVTLVDFGAYSLDRLEAGQWWRLGTANFLHIGLLHLGFNAMAITQVGPQVEAEFGRGRLLFFFIVTGIAAMGACWVIRMDAVSAGASGAVMGLIGALAAWGQRAGSSMGRDTRNQMLKWAAYTIVFGFFVHANNVAHAAGFAAGGLIGLCYRPSRLRGSAATPVSLAMGAVGGVAILTCLALCLLAKPSRRLLSAPQMMEQGDSETP